MNGALERRTLPAPRKGSLSSPAICKPQTKPEFLTVSSVSILSRIIFLCRILSHVPWAVEQHPRPPPLNARNMPQPRQEHLQTRLLPHVSCDRATELDDANESDVNCKANKNHPSFAFGFSAMNWFPGNGQLPCFWVIE